MSNGEELSLLPCPFCGGEAKIYECYSSVLPVPGEAARYVASCVQINCVDSRPRGTRAEAAAFWNRRPSPSAVEAAEVVDDETTPEMIRAGMDSLGWWIEPYNAPRESGVAIDSDMSEADAAFYNVQQMDAIADLYRAMRAASPPPASPSAPQGVEVRALEDLRTAVAAIDGTMISHFNHSDAGSNGAKAVVALITAAQNVLAILSAIQTSPEAGR